MQSNAGVLVRLPGAAAALVVAMVSAQTLLASPGQVVSSRHNLSVSGPGPVKSTSESQVCVFCHTPHNANPAPQLWNHQASGATNYSTYGSSSFDSGQVPGTFNTFPGRSAGQPAGSSRLCLSCHDGTIALGATLNNGTIAVSGGNGEFIPTRSHLGTDLSNDHPVSFARDPSDTQAIDPPPGDSVQLEGQTNFIQCVSCHDAHRQDGDPALPKFLVKSNVRSALCTTCHRKSGPGWSWAGSPHSSSSKSYTAVNNGGVSGLGSHTPYVTVADNGCEACHRPHTAPQAQRLLKAVNEPSVCLQCHGNTPVTQKNIAAAFAKPRAHSLETSTATSLHDYTELRPSPTNFSGGRRHADCSDCHNPHGAANAGSPGSGLHTTGTNAIGAASVLAGVPGVEPAVWPAVLPRSGSLPMNSASQGGYTLAPSSAQEYLLCFKCHSSYAFGTQPPLSPSGGPGTDVAAEVNPSNASYHPVVGAPHLRVPASNMVAPWNTTTSATRMYCTDCHGNDQATSATVPQGPHGSANPFILRFSSAQWSTTGPTLNSSAGFCFNCHDPARIRSTNTVHAKGAHQSTPCQSCHVAVPHGLFRPSLIALTRDPAPYNRGAALVVRWQRASTPNGYSKSYCYVTACHAHDDTSNAPISNANTYY
ncbi:MAG TPA: cytochrome c3 family protein [Vicinamibacterales bacterium]|nr:cytochrome c3 family protein [Vicinamibacterales bacterium]